MRFVVFGPPSITCLYIALSLSAQEHTWDYYKLHAEKAWKTYREQFECVSVSGSQATTTYDVFFDKQSGKALLSVIDGVGKQEKFIEHTILGKGNCVVITNAIREPEWRFTDFRLHKFSPLVPEELGHFQKHQEKVNIALHGLLYVCGLPIEKILGGGEAKILAVTVDEKASSDITVEMEIPENMLLAEIEVVDRQKLLRVKVVFDAEKLWTIKEYVVVWPNEREIKVSNETVGFHGCAVCSRSVLASLVYATDDFDALTEIREMTQSYAIISPELVTSKIAEAEALVEK
jgi:hypothetical protein